MSVPFYSLLLGGIIVIFASVLQVITGFGFALVSIPLLLYIFPGYEAVFITMLLSLAALAIQTRNNRHIARWDLIWRLLIAGLPGILIGIMISGRLNEAYLKGIVGVAVLGYVIIQLIKNRQINKASKETSATREPEGSVEETAEERKLPRGFYTAGFLSGILTGAAGIPGPPVVAVLIQILPKEAFRATTVNFFLINYAFAVVAAFWMLPSLTSINWGSVAILIIPLFMGYFLGNYIRKFINETTFKRLVYGLLIVVGVTSIGQTFLQII